MITSNRSGYYAKLAKEISSKITQITGRLVLIPGILGMIHVVENSLKTWSKIRRVRFYAETAESISSRKRPST